MLKLCKRKRGSLAFERKDFGALEEGEWHSDLLPVPQMCLCKAGRAAVSPSCGWSITGLVAGGL